MRWGIAVLTGSAWASIVLNISRDPARDPVATTFLVLVLLVGPVVACRMVRRCMWMYDDRTTYIRGAWYSVKTDARAISAVTFVPQSTRDTNRVYVTFQHPNGSPRAVCIAASVTKGQAMQTANELIGVLATHGDGKSIELSEGYVPPDEAKRAWRLSAFAVQRSTGGRR